MHAPTEDKSDGAKDTYCEELERVLDQSPKQKIFLEYFNAKIG
jgi:hypothetical protein